MSVTVYHVRFDCSLSGMSILLIPVNFTSLPLSFAKVYVSFVRLLPNFSLCRLLRQRNEVRPMIRPRKKGRLMIRQRNQGRPMIRQRNQVRPMIRQRNKVLPMTRSRGRFSRCCSRISNSRSDAVNSEKPFKVWAYRSLPLALNQSRPRGRLQAAIRRYTSMSERLLLINIIRILISYFLDFDNSTPLPTKLQVAKCFRLILLISFIIFVVCFQKSRGRSPTVKQTANSPPSSRPKSPPVYQPEKKTSKAKSGDKSGPKSPPVYQPEKTTSKAKSGDKSGPKSPPVYQPDKTTSKGKTRNPSPPVYQPEKRQRSPLRDPRLQKSVQSDPRSDSVGGAPPRDPQAPPLLLRIAKRPDPTAASTQTPGKGSEASKKGKGKITSRYGKSPDDPDDDPDFKESSSSSSSDSSDAFVTPSQPKPAKSAPKKPVPADDDFVYKVSGVLLQRYICFMYLK